jgi:hypothetical protein
LERQYSLIDFYTSRLTIRFIRKKL